MTEVFIDAWKELFGRIDGPMALRLVIQPLVSVALAIRAGLRDAREGRPVFGWAIFTSPEHRAELLRSGWKDVSKLFVMAAILDVVYQIIVYRRIHPIQSLVVATTVALVPYLLVRGAANRLAPGRKGA